MEQVIIDINEDCKEELNILEHEMPVPDGPFPVVTYDEAVDIVNSRDVEMSWVKIYPVQVKKH